MKLKSKHRSHFSKRELGFFIGFISVVAFLLVPLSHAASSVIKMPQPLPHIVKSYKSVTIYAGRPGMHDTGVRVKEGDYITIIAKGKIDLAGAIDRLRDGAYVRYPDGCLMYRIGKDSFMRIYSSDSSYTNSEKINRNANIYLGYMGSNVDAHGEEYPLERHFYSDDTGYFIVDIIVWKKYDPASIADFLEELSQKDSTNEALRKVAGSSKYQKGIFLQEIKLTQEVKETKEALSTLEDKALETKDQQNEEKLQELGQVDTEPQVTKDQKISQPEKKIAQTVEETKKAGLPFEAKDLPKEKDTETVKEKQVSELSQTELQEKVEQTVKTFKEKDVSEIKDKERQKQIAELKDKLNSAQQALRELEELKKKLAEEMDRRKDVMMQMAQLQEEKKKLSKSPPVIVIANPKDGINIESECVSLSGVTEDDSRIVQMDILVNNQLAKRRDHRRIQPDPREIRRIDFSERICLKEGKNEITIVAENDRGLTAKKNISVQLTKKKEAVWAVVIGVNKYKNLPSLKYAVNDAREFYRYLTQVNQIPKDHVWLLMDEEATLDKIRSTLATLLRRSAGRDDTVIIFLAGHGATEKDATSPDGDGLEKYILPHNADPKDLYTTALPMGEIARIFQRINSERLVFISDTCYSGASGGRTIPVIGARMNVSGAFLERLSQGKGRVIITASDANEVSVEKDELKHGVFTYYLLEGLRGKADFDKDGVVTVDEVYRYVSIKVPPATGQDQHPVKKGEVTGEIILGLVK